MAKKRAYKFVSDPALRGVMVEVPARLFDRVYDAVIKAGADPVRGRSWRVFYAPGQWNIVQRVVNALDNV